MQDDENNVNVETLNDTVEETVETPEETPAEDTFEVPEVDVDQLQATNKKLYERAKKAEADLKALRVGKFIKPVSTSMQPSVEETVILANGMPEELVESLKKVAKVQGLSSLIKAQNDPIFVAIKEKFEKDQKQRDASLSVSRGSGSVKAKKTFSTPGLSRDEHRKMVLES